MKQFSIWVVRFCFTFSLLSGCNAQSPTTESKTLALVNSIALPNVSGRIDHLAFDPKTERIFVAALGNNTVEVIDLKNGKSIHSIKGFGEPQGIAFVAMNNTTFIANGQTGACDVLNAETYQKIASIPLPGDADNVRYDSTNKKIYVGYGDGGIAVIDAVGFKQVGDVKLEGHPESFQLDISHQKIFVNVPDKQQIEVIDLTQNIVTARWKLTEAKSNFPMSLDLEHHRLFIGCRRPAKLLILDSDTGKLISTVNTDSDVDDVFYDPQNKRIYMSCGGGYIDVIEQQDSGSYVVTEKLTSHSGARTSLLLPGLHRLIVASPKSLVNNAFLLVYELKR
jgi:DNA-binding beta-propeller fold protein YncE